MSNSHSRSCAAASARAAGWAAGLVVVALPVSASAATYYVDPTGDDAAAGGEADPWRTLQHAADGVEPGDSVIVREGHYRGFELRASGTSSEPIAFSADPGVVVDRENPSTPDGINLHGSAHITIEGFAVEGVERAGIRAYDCQDVVIRDNRADKNGVWGILTSFCDDLLIEDNETSRSGEEHGIYVGNTCARAEIVRNVVWGNYENGIHLNGDLSAGDEGYVSDAHVEGNIVFENGEAGGSGINADGLRDSVLVNNVLYDNNAAGISLYRVDGAGGSRGNLVAHNTVVMPSGARPALQIRDESTNNEIVNNLFLHEDPDGAAVLVDASSLPELVSDYNGGTGRYSLDDGELLDLASWRERTGQGEHSFEAAADELFAAPESADFHLGLDSPAAGVGEREESVDIDFDGASRGACGGADPGAFAADGEACGEQDLGEDEENEPDREASLGADPGGGCGGGGAAGALGAVVLLGSAGRRGGFSSLFATS